MKLPRLMVLAIVLSLAFMGLQPIKAAPVRITMWHIATPGDPFRPVLQGALDRFNATHSDVQFDAQAIDNQAFKTQLQAATATNSQPDLFQTWGGGTLQSLINAGVVRDIPELTGDVARKFVPGALDSSTFNGKHYAIPANMAGVFLWYNEDLFQSHNIELPTTWSKLIAACQAFRAAGVVPIGLGNKEQWPGALWMVYLATRIGGPDVFNKAFSRAQGGSFADPVFVAAGARIQEAVKAGCFEDNYNNAAYGDAQIMLGTGKAPMQLQGDWNLGALKQANQDLTEKHIKTLPFPVVEGGQGDPRIMVGGTGQAFAISQKAPPETAEALIELLTSGEFGKSVAQNDFMPALAGHEQDIKDPIVQGMANILSGAPYIQLYYDQLLPPALAQVHLDTTQQLFGLSITPEQAAKHMEDVASSAAAVSPGAGRDSSLRALAQARNFYIGTAVAVEPLRHDPRYAETLKREFNMLTPENAMKIGTIQPARGSYNFSDADAIVNFAQANQMKVRGHTLVYFKDLPGWLTSGNFNRDQLLNILHDHIRNVAGHYRGQVVAWDVVNEAIDDSGAMRDTIWLRTIGPDYIEQAFRWAHEADPQALLFYNDFGGEGLGRKSDAIYALVQDLVKRGVPINGVGLQMHLDITKPTRAEDIATNIQRLAALGLQVQVTELDVDMSGWKGSLEEGLAAEAKVYHDVATVCLSTNACMALVTWGFTDLHTWLGNTPLPFDKSYRPKPAYYALMDALAGH